MLHAAVAVSVHAVIDIGDLAHSSVGGVLGRLPAPGKPSVVVGQGVARENSLKAHTDTGGNASHDLREDQIP